MLAEALIPNPSSFLAGVLGALTCAFIATTAAEMLPAMGANRLMFGFAVFIAVMTALVMAQFVGVPMTLAVPALVVACILILWWWFKRKKRRPPPPAPTE